MEKEIVRQGALLARKKTHESKGDDIDISLLIDAVFSLRLRLFLVICQLRLKLVRWKL